MCISLVYAVQLYYYARCTYHNNAGNLRYNIMGMPIYIYLPNTSFCWWLMNTERRKRLRSENVKAMKARTRQNRRLTVRFLTCLLSCEWQLWNKWMWCCETTASQRPRSPTLGPPSLPVHRLVPATSSFHAMEMGTWWVTIIVIHVVR